VAQAVTVASLNPFRISGTSMPPPVLLMVKLITLAFVLQGNVAGLPKPFLPLVPAIAEVGSPRTIELALELGFALMAALLFLNRRVRTASFVLGAIVLVAVLSSRPYYENNKVFVAFVLLLAGLSQSGRRPRFLQYQVVLLYFAAGFNKALNPGWQSGRFLEEWSSIHAFAVAYRPLASLLPGMALSAALCWLAIATELGLAAGFAMRRSVPVAIWVGVAYHTSLLLVTGRTFGLFWFAALSAYLAFVDFPRGPFTVTGASPGLARVWRRLDVEIAFRFMGDGGGGLVLTRDGITHRGLSAAVHMLLLNPVSYFVFVAAAAIPQPEYRWIAVVVFFFLAVVAHDAVVRRRHLELAAA
jgi:hypothetical protein